MKRAIFWIMCSAILLLSTACRQEETASAESELSLLKVGMRRPVDSLNPYLSTSQEGMIISNRFYPNLFREIPGLEKGLPKLEPYLVSHYEWDESRTRLTVTLKDDLQWRDGTPLTAEDVVYTLEIQKNPEVAWIAADLKKTLKGAEVVDDKNFVVDFVEPSAFNLLHLNEGVIIPKHFFSTVPVASWKSHPWEQNLLTFGPYKLEKFQGDEGLLLSADDEGVHYREIALMVIRDKETLFHLLKAGELDYAWALPVERIADIEASLNPAFYDDLSFCYIAWNAFAPGAYEEAAPESAAALEQLKKDRPHPILSDVRVRRALTMAMDRESYSRRFWGGRVSIPATPWHAGLAYGPRDVASYGYDPDAAGALLDEAGWKPGEDNLRYRDGKPLKLSVVCNLGSKIRENYLLAVQNDLKKIGVQMEVDLQEPGLYVTNGLNRNFDGWFGIMQAGSRPDVGGIFHSDAALGGYNFSSWTAVDGPLEALQHAEAGSEVGEIVAGLERQFHEDQPMTLLYAGKQIAAAKSKAVRPRGNYLDPLFGVETWSKKSPNP